MRLDGRKEGGRELVTGGVFVFGGFGVAPFFLFLFFLGKGGFGGGGGDSSFSKFLQLLESLFNIHPTDDPPSKKTSPRTKKRQKEKKKTHPNIGPPVPKNKLKLPTFIHVGNFSHPT